MKTQILPIPIDEHRILCGLVLSYLPHIKWRHSGLGMLQGYVMEGRDKEMRVHVWHRSLRKPGIEKSGLLHDHRFDLLSHVLVGSIMQTEYQLEDNRINGSHCLRSVTHARKSLSNTGGSSYFEEPTLLEGFHDVTEQVCYIHAGQSYFFPQREFHGTDFADDLCVTLITKTNQTDEPARILAPRDIPLVHAFSEPLHERAWSDPLWQAQEALRKVWLSDVPEKPTDDGPAFNPYMS